MLLEMTEHSGNSGILTGPWNTCKDLVVTEHIYRVSKKGSNLCCRDRTARFTPCEPTTSLRHRCKWVHLPSCCSFLAAFATECWKGFRKFGHFFSDALFFLAPRSVLYPLSFHLLIYLNTKKTKGNTWNRHITLGSFKKSLRLRSGTPFDSTVFFFLFFFHTSFSTAFCWNAN